MRRLPFLVNRLMRSSASASDCRQRHFPSFGDVLTLENSRMSVLPYPPSSSDESPVLKRRNFRFPNRFQHLSESDASPQKLFFLKLLDIRFSPKAYSTSPVTSSTSSDASSTSPSEFTVVSYLLSKSNPNPRTRKPSRHFMRRSSLA